MQSEKKSSSYKTYIFILGRKHLLNLSELCHKLKLQADQIVFFEQNILVLNLEEISNPQKLQDQLGGTIKICELIHQSYVSPEFEEDLHQKILESFQHKSKGLIGISTYNSTNLSYTEIKNTLKILKNNFKQSGKSLRYLNKDEQNIKTPVVIKENLINKGLELCIVEAENQYFYTKTIAIQNINEYSKRDYEKPERDSKNGMLPPKLSQIMINLADLKPGDTVYDPFCGNGSLLIEALLMNFNALGSDLKKKCKLYTITNLKWVHREYPQTQECSYEVSQKDAQEIEANLNFNAIVSEPFLGPPQQSLPEVKERNDIQKQLKTLYLNFFKNLFDKYQKLNIVLAIPCFKLENGYQFIESLTQEIKNIGFDSIDLIPEDIRQKLHIDIQKNRSIIYDRKDQIVAREIFRFVK